MSGKENAAARPLFPAEPPSGLGLEVMSAVPPREPAGLPNAFTPISAAQRLQQPPPKRRTQHAASPLPPLWPGQRYGYSRPGPQEPEPPLSYPAPPPFSGPMERQAEDLLQYQQKYWSQLQPHCGKAAPFGEAPLLPPVPAYPGEAMPLGMPPGVSGGMAPGAPSPPRTVWDEDFLEPEGEAFPGPWLPEPWEAPGPGWEPREREPIPFGEREIDRPAWVPQEPWGPREAAPPHREPEIRDMPGPGRGEPLWKRWIHRAFPLDPSQELTKGRLLQAFFVSLLSLVLVFSLLQVGRIVLSLMHNQEQMKAMREDYYAVAGVELAKDAARVELLPPGVTYLPTATPQVPETPPPGEKGDSPAALGSAWDQEEPGSPREGAVPSAPAPAAGQRTKITQYPGNPLNNVLEAFVALRQENPDIVGHLRIDGLVDETVVLRNNTYYLTHSARGAFSETGAVFVDEACGLRSPPENLLLRGRSTLPGRLLEPLWQYVTQGPEFVRAHAVLRMDTLYEEGEYAVFAVIVTSNQAGAPGYFNYAGYPSFPSDAQMESYVAAARQHSLYQIPLEVKVTDRLLTLSTLEGAEGTTMVLMARRLRQGETASSLMQTLQSIRVKEAGQ